MAFYAEAGFNHNDETNDPLTIDLTYISDDEDKEMIEF
jgi:hypothetical protein